MKCWWRSWRPAFCVVLALAVAFCLPSASALLPLGGNAKARGGLELVHITKTAGTSIERAGAEAGFQWGACHWHEDGGLEHLGCPTIPPPFKAVGVGVFRGEAAWHVPRRCLSEDPYAGARVFTVVRHPLERLVSEYNCRYVGYHGADREDPKVMNSFLQGQLRAVLEGTRRTFAVAMLPQHVFMTARDGSNGTNHVLRFERLREDFAALAREYNLPARLPEFAMMQASKNTSVSVSTLDECTRGLARRLYATDFELLGYDSGARDATSQLMVPLPAGCAPGLEPQLNGRSVEADLFRGCDEADDMRAGFRQALALHQTGDLTAAVSGYQSVLRHHPTAIPDVHNNLALALLALGRPGQAQDAWSDGWHRYRGNPLLRRNVNIIFAETQEEF